MRQGTIHTEILLEAQDREGKVVGEAKSGGPINPATGTLSLRPGESVKITLKMDLEFEGKFSLKALDPDNDGTIDLAEAQAGGTKKFAKLNPDNDGTLDEKELSGILDAAALKAADPDNDGTLDAKEYAAVIEQKFKAANPDNDGTIDKKELDSAAGKDLLKLIY